MGRLRALGDTRETFRLSSGTALHISAIFKLIRRGSREGQDRSRTEAKYVHLIAPQRITFPPSPFAVPDFPLRFPFSLCNSMNTGTSLSYLALASSLCGSRKSVGCASRRLCKTRRACVLLSVFISFIQKEIRKRCCILNLRKINPKRQIAFRRKYELFISFSIY